MPITVIINLVWGLSQQEIPSTNRCCSESQDSQKHSLNEKTQHAVSEKNLNAGKYKIKSFKFHVAYIKLKLMLVEGMLVLSFLVEH